MRVLHLTWNEGLSAVFPSQILRPMGLLKSQGRDISLIVGSPLGEFLRKQPRAAWRSRIAMARETFGLSLLRIPTSPARGRGFIHEQALAARWLSTRIGRSELVILHCRGRCAAEVGLAVRARRPRVRVVFDCRGWEGPELLYASGFRSEEGAPAGLVAASRSMDMRQQAVARASDAIIVVSQAMREVVQKQWAVPDDRVVVVPCCTAIDRSPLEHRNTTRKHLGFEGRFVVVYCGSIKGYQMVEATLELFEMIRGVRDEALFFGITPSRDRLTELLRGRGIPQENFKVISAAHTEVPELLAAADMAVLLRDRSRVNSVAAPIKFAEYLAAGIPVALTDRIGDYSTSVCSNGVGCVLPDAHLSQDSRNVVAAFLDAYPMHAAAAELRARCHALAARELSAERACVATDALYRALSGETDHSAGRSVVVADAVSSETAA